jgi:hypothetical protein
MAPSFVVGCSWFGRRAAERAEGERVRGQKEAQESSRTPLEFHEKTGYNYDPSPTCTFWLAKEVKSM